MELDELHVHQLGARVVRERVPIPGPLPAVARNLVGPTGSARREHDGAGRKDLEPSTLALVSNDAGGATVRREHPDDGEFHMDGDAALNPVILQRANQLESCSIADVRQAWIAVAAEIALEDAPVRRAIEHGSPRLELAHAIRGFLRVQLRHAPVVDVLAAAHGVGEMDLPVVAIVHVGERGRDTTFGHDRVRLAEQRLADQANSDAGGRRLDRRAQSGTAGADDDHVVGVGLNIH